MANNAESVGQLLANSALMKGDRELFRKPEPPPAEAAKSAAQPTAAPISHDSKAVAAVLLAMLDERLQAEEAAFAAGSKMPALNAEEVDASKRVAQKYATDGLIDGADIEAPQQFAQGDTARASIIPPAASPDLQTFIQRFAAFAAGQPVDAKSADLTAARWTRPSASTAFNTASVLRFAGIAAGLFWLAMIFIGWIAR